MKKLFSIIALLVLSATAVYAQHDMSMQMQAVQGVASTSDANRHYLMHLANLASPSVAGATNPSDNAVAISTAQEFNSWFTNAIQGFNDVQVTVTDPSVQQSRLTDFLSQRDAQVAYYMGQLNAKLTLKGKEEVARFISGTIPNMQSGVKQEAYNNMKADLASRAGDSGTGQYNCGHPGYTCNVTYSLAAAINNDGSSVITDDFNRSGAPGANWTIDTGTWVLSNNAATITAAGNGPGGRAIMHWNTSLAASSFSQRKISVLPNSGNNQEVFVRGTSAYNGYYAGLYNSGSGYQVILAKYVGTTWTNLAFYAVSPVSGDTLALEAQGTTLSVFYKGATVLQVDDSSISAAGRTGLSGTLQSGSSDDWAGGNLGLTLSFNPIIDGSESMDGSPPGVFHTPATWLSINGVQNLQSSSPVCTSCYIQASGLYQVGLLSGADTTIADGSQITCTEGGIFFVTNPDAGHLEPAFTTVQNIDQTHSQGGTVFINGPDGPYEWSEPNTSFVSFLPDQPAETWHYFAVSPYVGYTYKVQNWCSNTNYPDADFTNFKAVLPEIYLTGGTWGLDNIIKQGGTIQMETPLWRIFTTSSWSVAPWFSLYEIIFGVNNNLAWNRPVAHALPQLYMDGYPKGFCTVTDTGGSGGSNRYKVNVTPGLATLGGTSCIEHNNRYNNDGNPIPCPH